MVGSYLTAVVAVAVLAVGWVAVQSAWRRTFPEAAAGDPDVLARRGGCDGCDDSETCGRDAAGCKEGYR